MKLKRLPVAEINEFQSDIEQKIVAHLEPELNRAELSLLQHREPVDMAACGALMAYARVDEAVKAVQNTCIYDDNIYLPRVILALARCAQGDTIFRKNCVAVCKTHSIKTEPS